MTKKIYVASSWRNQYQPDVVKALRAQNHTVYDFRNPTIEGHGYDQANCTVVPGFSWSMIDENWEIWTFSEYKEALFHDSAEMGFNLDMAALLNCDACVLVLPCGKSAHLELGFAAAMNKDTYIYCPTFEDFEPELMYKMCDNLTDSIHELLELLQ